MNIGRLRQFHTSFGCALVSLAMSMVNSWTAYTTELYHSNTTNPMSSSMTKAEEALLGSLPSLGAMLGVTVTGIVIDNLGRRNGGVLLSLPILLSWIFVNVTTSITVVLAARFFAGISGGGAMMLTPIFTSEIAEDSIRGTLASSGMFLYCTGILAAYAMGWTLSYRTTIWINLTLCVISSIVIMLMNESPVYLLKKNREEDAKISIAKYRGVSVSSKVVLEELSKLKQQIMPSVELVSFKDAEANTTSEEADKKNALLDETTLTKPRNISTIKLLLTEPASRRAFIVLASVASLQVFMGNVPVQVYAKTVFTEADPSKSDFYTIIFAVILFLGCALSTIITDKVGRRVLIISSSALVFIFLIILGFLLQTKIAPPSVTVIIIFMYCFFFISGAGTVPYVLLAEVFIPEVQNLASMIIIELVWLLNFFILGIFPYMNSAFGIHGSFYIFGMVGLINAVYAYFYVPETKGLSSTQIQEAFLSWTLK